MELEWKKSTTSLAYHLTNVHGLEKGAPAHQQKRLKLGPSSSPFSLALTEKEVVCATWALNGLSLQGY